MNHTPNPIPDLFAYPMGLLGVTVRALKDEAGSIWIVAADLGAALGIRSWGRSLQQAHVSASDTRQRKITPGKGAPALLVSESGMYALVLNSRKPAARKLRRWIMETVLPHIRETGGYFIGDEHAPRGPANLPPDAAQCVT